MANTSYANLGSERCVHESAVVGLPTTGGAGAPEPAPDGGSDEAGNDQQHAHQRDSMNDGLSGQHG
jgi:hypothetical protein